MSRSLFVFQGGGPTAVINATLAGVLEAAKPHFESVIGLPHSLEGADGRQTIDLSHFLRGGDATTGLNRLASTPGAALGSSRKKTSADDFARVLRLMQQKGADTLIGIGGNGTMATLQMMADHARDVGHEIVVSGVPKTVDNDLPGVHVAPGYGSAARFVALATRDYGYDFRAMSSFDDVTILETMGRNSGWLAAASVLLKQCDHDPPHIVLVPERPVDETELLAEVRRQHVHRGHVFIVVNEMLHDLNGGLIGEAFQNGPCDSLGRRMYSLSLGTGNYLAQRIWSELGLQTRCLRPGNLGRAMSFCVSEPDRELARQVGVEALAAVAEGNGAGQMVTIDAQLGFALQPLSDSQGSRSLPAEFLAIDPFGIAEDFRSYAQPLIGDVEPLAAGI
ncbi:diphosphate--fructose-6-phosphate 1-phosphotransferase [Pelagibius sp. Alg239-R121]|uniref:diphosphate--fructose-6-phosphate 1-phosphotransferase n=1 Tax=Pelagibius sp. Alg239-R121 TaxID=2993448 RepID=UPI0024A6CB10|nr:diphosphate--fructose-6-phosphate 1-phosphotransferase [Pelagibius sp. Alg239-R121]